jgi:hypothetical protein
MIIFTISAAYKETSFPYLTHLQILEVLFTPNNGLFFIRPYSIIHSSVRIYL